jgi:hypothetical protein
MSFIQRTNSGVNYFYGKRAYFRINQQQFSWFSLCDKVVFTLN